MDSSLGTGFMAVFAISGSVVFLAMQAHKRLLSDFMKKMEFEFKSPSGIVKDEPKKKVRFVDDVMMESPAAADRPFTGKTYTERAVKAAGKRDNDDENLEAMPLNWQAMYKGILKYKNLRGCM